MTKDEIKDSIIQKQDELILRKCKHKPNCYIMQDWSEALDALNNTEIAFRTEDWHIAVADVYEKMQTCTCGLNKLTEDIASFKSRLAEAEEEKPKLSMDEMAKRIAVLYKESNPHDRAVIAKICDESLDRSGRLLGDIRSLAAPLKV